MLILKNKKYGAFRKYRFGDLWVQYGSPLVSIRTVSEPDVPRFLIQHHRLLLKKTQKVAGSFWNKVNVEKRFSHVTYADPVEMIYVSFECVSFLVLNGFSNIECRPKNPDRKTLL